MRIPLNTRELNFFVKEDGAALLNKLFFYQIHLADFLLKKESRSDFSKRPLLIIKTKI